MILRRVSPFSGQGWKFYGDSQNASRKNDLGQISKTIWSKDDKSLALRTHCQTSGWSLTEQDPFNNVARTCIEASAAAFEEHNPYTLMLLMKPLHYLLIFRQELLETHRYTYKKKQNHKNRWSLEVIMLKVWHMKLRKMHGN
jgi:hypothetical protein